MPPAVVHPVEWYGVDKPRGVEPLKPPEPPPEDRTDWSGYAQRRKVEDDLQGAARQAELQPAGKADPIQQVLASARRAGLNQTEVTQLRTHLVALLPSVQAEDLKFLRNTVLRCAQPLKALRSLLEMTEIASQNPGRLRRDVALLLVRGVADRLGGKPLAGGETIKPQEASFAARALSRMTDADYTHATRILESAEEDGDRLKILKAIAERHDSLVNPAINDLFRNMTGLPSYFLGEVQSYAADLLSQTGEVKADAVGKTNPLDVHPEEYLRDGFFTPDQQIQGGIYGFCSAAMAMRCRQEGANPETLRQLVDVLAQIGEGLVEQSGDDPDLLLDDATRDAIQSLEDLGDVEQSLAISELLIAARPCVQQFRDLAALAVHLERILSHMIS